jgi:hypothetical protein
MTGISPRLLTALMIVPLLASCAQVHQFARTEQSRARCAPSRKVPPRADTLVVGSSGAAHNGGGTASAADKVICEGGLTR